MERGRSWSKRYGKWEVQILLTPTPPPLSSAEHGVWDKKCPFCRISHDQPVSIVAFYICSLAMLKETLIAKVLAFCLECPK